MADLSAVQASRARKTEDERPAKVSHERFIPVRTGNALLALRVFRSRPVHPCVRGTHLHGAVRLPGRPHSL